MNKEGGKMIEGTQVENEWGERGKIIAIEDDVAYILMEDLYGEEFVNVILFNDAGEIVERWE